MRETPEHGDTYKLHQQNLAIIVMGSNNCFKTDNYGKCAEAPGKRKDDG